MGKKKRPDKKPPKASREAAQKFSPKAGDSPGPAGPTARALDGVLENTYVHIAVILLLGLLAYSNTFSVPFQWDGPGIVRDNSIVHDLGYFADTSSAAGEKHYHFLKRRYVPFLSFALNYAVHGESVGGYHAVNLTIHLLNALLLYLLVLGLLRSPGLANSSLRERAGPVAFFAAALFVSHPLQSMAVTYIYQRLTSLVALFYILSVLSYVYSRLSEDRLKRYGLYALCLASSVLAMKSKENAFTLPVTITIVEFVFFHGRVTTRALRLVPLFLTMAIVPLSMMGLEGEAPGLAGKMDAASRMSETVDRYPYLILQFKVLMLYLRLLFYPAGLSLEHDVIQPTSFAEPAVFVSFALLAILFTWAAYHAFRPAQRDSGAKLLGFGILWFFVTISVESSFIPLFMEAQEHRMYLPMAGLAPAAATLLFTLTGSFKDRKLATDLTLCALIVPLALTGLTFARNTDWKTNVSLWESTVRIVPEDASSNNNLAAAYKNIGRNDEAHVLYEKAVRINPNSPKYVKNLANSYWQKGMNERAEELFIKSLEIKDDAKVRVDLGLLYMETDREDLALEYLTSGAEMDPNDAVAHYNLGNLHWLRSMTALAEEAFKRGLAIEPESPKLLNNLGALYTETGKTGLAMQHLEHAAALEPENPDTHFNLGNAYLKAGKDKKAAGEFRAVLKINPGDEGAKKKLRALE